MTDLKSELESLANTPLEETVKWLRQYKQRQYKRSHQSQNTAYKREWRRNNLEQARATEKRKKARQIERNKERRSMLPFIGVDGEGAGHGKDHIYWLLRVGDDVLCHKDGSELKSLEILTWLADLGKSKINNRGIPVGYYLEYDFTMILRHLPIKNLKELYGPANVCIRTTCNHSDKMHVGERGPCMTKECSCSRYIRTGNTIIWPDSQDTKHYIKVAVRHNQLKVAWNDGLYFTVTDVADNFQSSFLNTILKWQTNEDGTKLITDDEIERIRTNKERRSSFEIGFDQETYNYNKLEVDLLSRIMTRFREVCAESDLIPDMWTGPGRLAEKIFKNVKLPEKKDLNISPFIEGLAEYAYYGGRFEGIHFGYHQKVWEYDINSAYPHAYTKLPCLLKGHGTWEEASFEEIQEKNLQNSLISLRMTVPVFQTILDRRKTEPTTKCLYKSPEDQNKVCGLPMRDTIGRITFPREVHGLYWWPEVRETLALYNAEKTPYSLQIEKCFTWRQTCNDAPGDFITPLYEYRKSIGKSAKGYPIKLTLNSLYGKAAQKVGRPRWANGVWAGLITSITRARLLEATRLLGSHNIVSYQTDGITSKVPGLKELCGSQLGEWEEEIYEGFYLFQSGVYTYTTNGEKHHKTRGITVKEFEASKEHIIAVWNKEGWNGICDLPPRESFITVKLGILWNKPELIGRWIQQTRTINFFANNEKRETWLDIKPGESRLTTNGETYPPGGVHKYFAKRKYGRNPIIPTDKTLDYSLPYTKEMAQLVNKITQEEAFQTLAYTPTGSPYTIEVSED